MVLQSNEQNTKFAVILFKLKYSFIVTLSYDSI
jgi:hypothetical protein